ncbi:MAG: CpsD/CapB family tyrosine-protein kinase [Candidatus Latescibacterota bacterium]
MQRQTAGQEAQQPPEAGTALVAAERALLRRSDQSVARQVLYQTTVPYWKSPEGMFDDVQRILDRILLQSRKHDLRVVGVTSARPGEGASTVASLLALMHAARHNGAARDAAAQMAEIDLERGLGVEAPPAGEGGGTLLIDAQVRHPTLHRLFRAPAKPGLIDLLQDPECLRTGLREGPQHGLRIITAGTPNGGLAARVEPARLQSLLTVLRESYPLILLDLPSVLRYPEGAAFSRLCDGVVLVIRAGRTRYEVVREAKTRLESADVRIIGSVLNQRRFYIPAFLYRRL